MTRRGIVLALALLVASACSQIPGIPGNPAASPATSPTPTLDASVPTPNGFPIDVPIYPKARLTAAASFASGAQTAWGMEWETTDGAGKVTAFYSRQLSVGDWTLTPTGQTNGAAFAAAFARKSNPHDRGTLAISSAAGVTAIALSLISS